MHPHPAPLPRSFALWVLILLSMACAGPRADQNAEVELETLPELEVAGSESTVRRQLSIARDEVDRRLAASPRDEQALSDAFGHLAMVYNAYQYLDAAVVAYRNASKLAPPEPRWPYYLAFIHQLRGELPEATSLYERVLELDPEDATTHLRLAEVYLEANQLEAAGEHFTYALAQRPASAAAHYGLGRIAASAERYEDAIRYFEQALAEQPGAQQVHYALALALRQNGDGEGAQRHLEQQGEVEVVIADRRLAEIAALGRGTEFHSLRGEIALAEDRCHEAAASFRQALDLAPGDSDTRAGLAAALRDCGDLEGAIDQLLLSTLANSNSADRLPRVDAPAGFTLPTRPDLSRLDAPVRQRLESLHGDVAQALSEGRYGRVAILLGQLGQLYVAYGLEDAAKHHFIAARQLHPGEASWSYYLAVLAQQREPEHARSELRSFLELRPQDLPAWVRLGQIELELDHVEAAEDAFHHALEIASSHAAALFGLGRAALARDDPEAAIPLLLRALEQQPEAGRIHHVLGQAFRNQRDLDQARVHLSQANDVDVRFADPLIDGLGDVLTLTAFQVVLRMASDPSVSPEDHLGFALSKLGGVHGAAEQLSNALDAPASALNAAARARLHYVAGGLWVRRTEDPRAIEHFRAALALDAEILDAHVKLGNALARQSDLRGAVAAYTTALDHDSAHQPALRKRATARAATGDVIGATLDLRRLMDLAPDDATVRIQLARALEAGGDLQAAENVLRDALTERSEAEIHLALGDLARRQAAFPAAAESYRNALRKDPEATGARLQLAAILGHLGQYEEALEHYARLLSLDPGHLDGRLGQATGLVLLARYDEARRSLEDGLRAAPGQPHLAHFLARLLAIVPTHELRDGERAVELALEVFRLHSTTQAAQTVAMALAAAGRFDEASTWQRRLIDEATQRQDRAFIERLRPQLTAYEAGRAWHATSPDQMIVLPSAG